MKIRENYTEEIEQKVKFAEKTAKFEEISSISPYLSVFFPQTLVLYRSFLSELHLILHFQQTYSLSPLLM